MKALRISYRLAMTALAVFAVVGLAVWMSAGGDRLTSRVSPPTLKQVELDVTRTFADVAHWPVEEFAKKNLSNKGGILLFDVRSHDEYRVSRIAGAERVDPSMTAEAFLESHGQAVQGKTVVFYCSVGVRSSRLARRVQQGLKSAGANVVYNLIGGVFRWHNDDRPLVNDSGGTSKVHGFDKYWRLLLERQELTVLSAEQPS